MALGTYAGYVAFTGGTYDATAQTALTAILGGVEAAVKRLCSPFLFEPATLTDVILDAPWSSDTLLLPALPVRSVTTLYCRADARGVAANFTAADLLTAGTDYQLVIDDFVNGWARAGRVRRLNRNVWGVEYRRPLGRLGYEPQPGAGAIKVTFEAGCAAVPAEVTQAVYLATGLVYARRGGAPVTSESWNNASRSFAGPFTADAAVNSPDVMALLAPYTSQIRLGS